MTPNDKYPVRGCENLSSPIQMQLQFAINLQCFFVSLLIRLRWKSISNIFLGALKPLNRLATPNLIHFSLHRRPWDSLSLKITSDFWFLLFAL